MKVPCNIIEDLLPLYHDNVCSEESRAMVKEHLQTCEKCRTLLAMMDDNIEEAALVNDDRPIRAMKKAWDRTKKKSFRRGMRIGITVIAVIALFVLAVLFIPGFQTLRQNLHQRVLSRRNTRRCDDPGGLLGSGPI